jgi:acyl carrier protein
VSRGYLNREELTSERFVPNPFKSDEILYRAGDVGRWMADGTLEFFGRNDDQIQVRGFRVEPAEIEACLAVHETVEKAVVIAKEGNSGIKELAAYITSSKPANQFNVNMLREHLRKTLTDYMIPSYFVRLDEFPLTSNKKVDRRALPDPKTHRPQKEADSVMPQTDAEERIAGIWQEALELQKVGIHDNFFDLGGHSLLMVRIRNKLKDVFEQEISIVELFKYPTIHSLAGYLSGEGEASDSSRQGHDRAESREARKDIRKAHRKSRLAHRRDG